MKGLENVKRPAASAPGALSERQLTVEEMIGEGDRVAARGTVPYTTRAPQLSPDATFVIPAGKTVISAGVSIVQLHAGKIPEERSWLPFRAAARWPSAAIVARSHTWTRWRPTDCVSGCQPATFIRRTWPLNAPPNMSQARWCTPLTTTYDEGIRD